MIYGIGTDLCDIRRIEKVYNRFGNKFIHKLLSNEEQAAMPENITSGWLAKRFAAKEATVKAMGTAFRNGLFLSDIRIFNDPNGKPVIKLSPLAAGFLPENNKLFLSLTDEKAYAAAFVVIEHNISNPLKGY